MAIKKSPSVFTKAGAGADPTLIQRLFAGLYDKENVDSFMQQYAGNSKKSQKQILNTINTASANPLSGKALLNDAPDTGLGTTTKLMGNWIGDHKLKSAGIGALGAANIAGLFDNDQMGGQLVGGALGGLGVPMLVNKITGVPLSTSTALMSGLGGGMLGSLFDKLIAKRQQEEQMMQQYQGQY